MYLAHNLYIRFNLTFCLQIMPIRDLKWRTIKWRDKIPRVLMIKKPGFKTLTKDHAFNYFVEAL